MDPNNDEQSQPKAIQDMPNNNFPPKQIDINSEDGSISPVPGQNFQSNNTPAPEVATESVDKPNETVNEELTSEESTPEGTIDSNNAQPTDNQSSVSNEPIDLPTDTDQNNVVDDSKENPLAVPTQPKPKSGVPKIAITLAILVALSLTAVAVYVFISGNSDKENTTNTSNASTEQQSTQAQPVTSSEVDQTVDQIDQDINKTTNDEDLPSSESVSDQSLNLQ